MDNDTVHERERVAGLVHKLNEYAKILRQLANDARELINEKNQLRNNVGYTEMEMQSKNLLSMALRQRVDYLSTKVTDIARRTSALIEHSITDEIVKLELELVLADVESSAHYAGQVVNALMFN